MGGDDLATVLDPADIQGRGAGRALDAQRAAAAESNATQRYIFDETRKDAAPWRETGMRALSGLENADFQKDFTMADFQSDPGYQFRMSEGMKAIERSAAARGGLNSGSTMKALSRFGQDTASNEYSNAYNRFNADRDRRFNRLASLSGVGQTANSEIAGARNMMGNSISENAIGIGNASAAREQAGSNNFRQTAGQAAGIMGMAFSDVRLKKNLVKLEVSQFKDVPTYSYEYTHERLGKGKFVGVIAQDLLAINPRHPAVIDTPIGYAVNYSLLERAE